MHDSLSRSLQRLPQIATPTTHGVSLTPTALKKAASGQDTQKVYDL